MLRRISIPVLLILCGCQKLLPPPSSQPVTSGPRSGPKVVPATATKPADKEARPRRPRPSWIIFREAVDEEKDVICDSQYRGGRRLHVHTDNIRKLSLDISKLPVGAPESGPWDLQIDQQGIQIFGLRGNLKVLDLVRSKNGEWSVVPGSHRPMP